MLLFKDLIQIPVKLLPRVTPFFSHFIQCDGITLSQVLSLKSDYKSAIVKLCSLGCCVEDNVAVFEVLSQLCGLK